MGPSSYAAFSLALLLTCLGSAAYSKNNCPDCCNYGNKVVHNGNWYPGDIKKCLCSDGQWTKCEDYPKPDTYANPNIYHPNNEYRPDNEYRPQQHIHSPRQYQPSPAPYQAAPAYGNPSNGYRK